MMDPHDTERVKRHLTSLVQDAALYLDTHAYKILAINPTPGEASQRANLGPAWREHVDPDQLEMSSPFRCIMGQLSNHGIMLGFEWIDGITPYDYPPELALCLPDYLLTEDDYQENAWGMLTHLWRRVLSGDLPSSPSKAHETTTDCPCGGGVYCPEDDS